MCSATGFGHPTPERFDGSRRTGYSFIRRSKAANRNSQSFVFTREFRDSRNLIFHPLLHSTLFFSGRMTRSRRWTTQFRAKFSKRASSDWPAAANGPCCSSPTSSICCPTRTKSLSWKTTAFAFRASSMRLKRWTRVLWRAGGRRPAAMLMSREGRRANAGSWSSMLRLLAASFGKNSRMKYFHEIELIIHFFGV